MSSHCSGCGSVELALCFIHAACRSQSLDMVMEGWSCCVRSQSFPWGQDLPTMFAHALLNDAPCQVWGPTEDVDAMCQKALKARMNPDGHGHGHVCLDLFSLLGEAAMLPNPVDTFSKQPWQVVLTAFRRMHLSSHAFCIGHGCLCKLPMASVDVTGTPCRDWSPVGNRAGPQGPDWCVMLAWCQVMLCLAVPVIVHENVPQFWPQLLHDIFGHAYHVTSMVVDCADAGFHLIARKRRYTIMYHKAKARVMCDPWWVYESMRHRMLSFHLISWAIQTASLPLVRR